MPLDRIVGSKLPQWADRDRAPGVRFDSATYIGVVKDNVDSTRSGRLRVWIPDFGGIETDERAWQTVSYASPFFGATFVGEGTANNKFTSTNHTYGMWMVPPDLNNQVLCTFIGGRPDDGFWFACVNPTLSHYMVPGLAAGNTPTDIADASDGINPSLLPPTSPDKQYLPVAEFNENDPNSFVSSFYNNTKPVHEFQANILFQQGLDRDPIRGAVSSTSQRESPSHVFGISTPGRAFGNDPADDPNYESKLAAGTIGTSDYQVKTRKGGHTFIMDDGDVNGTDQIVRIRSAGGHEILMNDTANVMYIINNVGSSWIELTQDGNMNIYNGGKFSVRAEGDINLHADNNVNINAGGSINMNATDSINATSADVVISATNSTLLFGGKVNIGSGGAMNIGAGTIAIGSTGAISIDGSTLDLNSKGGSNNITGLSLQQTQFPDTSFNANTRLWNSVPNSASSIVSVFPTHEPYTRTPPGPVPTKSLPPTLCQPQTSAASAPANYVLPPPNGNKLDNGKVNGSPVPWTTDQAFITAVQSISNSLNLNYVDMLSCMHLETGGTMDPAITNSMGFTGLIQFGTPAATACGTTTAALRAMDRVTQCNYVLKYFQVNKLNSKAPSPRLVDIYLTILWPAAIGQALDYIIWNSVGSTSKYYQANHGFDTANQGFITVQMVANSIANHQTAVKQALANAGTTNPTSDSATSSAIGVSDGSGNSVNTGAVNNSNLGPQQAAGKSVSNTCPTDWLNKNTAYNAPTGIGSSNPALTQAQAKAMYAELGYFESQWNYSQVSSDNQRIGKYQVDAPYLASAGYIKPDAIKQYGNNTLVQSESWTNKDGIGNQTAFLNNTSVQDALQTTEFSTNYDALVANGGILSTDDICSAAGMLFVAHMFRSADLALEWRTTGQVQNVPSNIGMAGTPEDYYNHGRYAIDVLSTNAQAATVNSDVTPPSGVNISGIDPNTVLNFTGQGSGTLAAFQQTSSAFQNALLSAAQAYNTATGQKITINSAYRDAAYQQQLYNRWLAAGGGPNVPTAGGITTPAKPGGKPESHGSGVAIDSSQSPLVNKTINLAQFGLRWGGTFTKPDQVHIQLAGWTPSN